MTAPGHARARGWVEHLTTGGTTSWSAWEAEVAAATGAVPGAQQLELLRRLNLAGRPDRRLVDRVLVASAPGRGTPDLELLGASSASAFGPRPVDPVQLPVEELIRVAAGLVAEDLVETGTPEPERPPFLALRQSLAPAYRLVGEPWAAPLIRAELRRQGWVPGGRTATVLVLASDYPSLVTSSWISRCFGEGAPPWRAWLDPFVAADRCPPRADLVRLAGRHRSPEFLFDARAIPGLLRRRGFPRPNLPSLPRPGADAAETARRVGATLDLLVLPQRRAELLTRTLLPRLGTSELPALRLPPAAMDWAAARGEAMHLAIGRAGYRVHGDLEGLLTVPVEGVEAPRDDRVLDLLLGLLLAGPGDDGRVGPS